MKTRANKVVGERVITKYGSRRLYDTTESAYIAFADLKNLIYQNISFCIIDANTKLDVTRSVLVQVISEDKKFRDDAFSVELMKQLIQLYSNPMRGLYGAHLENAFMALVTHYESIIGASLRGDRPPLDNSFCLDAIDPMINQFIGEYSRHISGFLTDLQKQLSSTQDR